MNINSTGSSIVNICSHLSLFIFSSIETIVVDLPAQVGQVIKTSQLFNSVNSLVDGGNNNSSIVITLLEILLITKEILPNL
ncbi:MAG: hypothetical protein Q8S84_05895 [bacterium]|nr:hypothetical protein [bacterium]MDP3381011.1 hypothetical protein [bacterium]